MSDDKKEADNAAEDGQEQPAVTSTDLKKRDASLLAQMKRMIEQSTQANTALFQQLAEQLKPQPPAEGAENKDEVKAQLAAMQKQMERLKAERDEQQRRFEAAESLRKATERRQALLREAARIEINDPELREAFADRYQGKVVHTADGQIAFTKGPDDYVTLADAIDDLAKGPAKAYIAPRGAEGSGTRGVRPSNGVRKIGGLPSFQDAESMLKNALGVGGGD